MWAASRGVRLGLALAAGALPVLLFAYAGGPPVRRTGAPGDRSCLDANCHVGDRIENSPAVSLETGAGLTYTPGGLRQRWTVRIADPAARVYGVQLTVRTAADPARGAAGELVAVDPTNTTVLCEDNQPRSAGPCRAAAPVQFFLHTEPRRAGEFTVDWVPPPSDLGNLEVYVAANASVAGQRNSRIHFRTFRLTPAGRAAEVALVDAASQSPRFASGSWVSVYGAGLARSTRAWSEADFREGRLPTSLDGVELRINGRPAVLSFVSPGQINALAPDDEARGAVPFTVSLNGQAVASGVANKLPVAPALFEHAGVTPKRAAAWFPSPGRVVLFGTGFGPTIPPSPFERIVSEPAPLAAPATFLIGGRRAVVEWTGLVGPGLYQFKLALPEPLPAGDHLLSAETRGAATQDGLWLRIP